jgi:hypothetical protein
MTTWTRDRAPRRCGQCGREILVGDVCLWITFDRCTVKKYRCAACAGPAPADLPELPVLETTPVALPLVRFQPDMLPLDWKQPAAHDREPGEEG